MGTKHVFPVQESKYLKVFAQNESFTDYLGMQSQSEYFENSDIIIINFVFVLAGYQRFSSSHCFSFLQRDILCYVRSGIMVREEFVDCPPAGSGWLPYTFLYIQNGKFVHSAISVEDEKYPPHRFIPRCDVCYIPMSTNC